RERQRIGFAVVAGNDLLQGAQPLAVHEPVGLVDENERAVSGDPGLVQLAFLELPDGETLDRAMRDPGHAQAHAVTLAAAGPVPARRDRASGEALRRRAR